MGFGGLESNLKGRIQPQDLQIPTTTMLERSFEGVPAMDDAEAVAAEAELVVDADGFGKAEGPAVEEAVEEAV